MDIIKEIKKIMIDENMNIVSLAEKLNTSQPNLSKKFKRNNPTISDLEEIAAALNREIEINFIKK
ncbi:MAG TPA: helix-turn-helix domain-containing protein [Terrisporobacter glycolicus]|uniref:helix-turn-helix domain-containing protein n=1 Tax=Terrisporobacter TaxID=1505652 RepID=UPI0008E3A1BC|nr:MULTISPECIES: helix-turn-helix domain-containing protein [Terrisporobacter]SFJ33057.1 Cro/C1-type HTH DNA-binding domain-containing protein [Terrisporobacter glycolicus]HBI92101.1 helix-turn-helix domain-containing protein [Terrisporobacter hibernicus]